MTTTTYFTVPAPGHYGDRARVYSAHSTLAAAIRACGTSGRVVVRAGSKAKGSEWIRVYEETYPIAHS